MYNLLYKIAQNTAGIPPETGDSVYALASKVAQNTAGTPPVVGDSIYNLLYKIAGNTAGALPVPGDRSYDLIYKITANTEGSNIPKVGDGRYNLFTKIAGNTAGGVEPPEPPSVDADALNFFTRAGIIDSAQQNATNNLVVALKTAGIWAKMRTLYPFIGGTASSHSCNLKDATAQIVWNGAVTHGVNGITGAGGVGEGINLLTTTYGNIAFGVYNRTSDSGLYDIATNPNARYNIAPHWSGTFYGSVGDDTQYVAVGGITDAMGFYVMSRLSVSSFKAYKNGAQFGPANNTPPLALSGAIFQILGWSSTHNLALAFISDGLSDSEVTALNTAVTVYQTALGRNI